MTRRTRSGRPCEWCGYDHADDGVGAALARRWHEAHDAGAGLRFELDLLQQPTDRRGSEDEQ